MSRRLTDEQRMFHHAVYSKVQEIPISKATSYGHIAKLIQRPKNSRHVGQSLKNFETINQLIEAEYRYNDGIPWWRVVNSQGMISKREKSDGVVRQVELLRNEGIEVVEKGGCYFVDFNECGWFPAPMDDASDDDSDGDSDNQDDIEVKQEEEDGIFVKYESC